MRWSYSSAQTFALCPRKWFFGSVLANSRAADPLRKEAFLLKQLDNIHAWRGKLTDYVISKKIIPELNKKLPVELDKTLTYADELIEKQISFAKTKQHRTGISKSANPECYCALYEIDYDGSLNEESLATAKEEIHASLTNFHKSKLLDTIYEEKPYLIAQRPLQTSFADVTIISYPDLIIFFEKQNPMIVDWKVQAPRYKRDHWIQLGIYAWVLSKVKPHPDFPFKQENVRKDPTNIGLMEFQLLRNQEKKYVLTPNDILDIEDFLFNTANQVMAITEGKTKLSDLDIEMFPTTALPGLCKKCEFKKICWESEGGNNVFN